MTYHFFLNSCVNDKVDRLCSPPQILPLLCREENPPGLVAFWLLGQERQQASLARVQDHRHHLTQVGSQPGALSLEDALGTMDLLHNNYKQK